MEIRHLRYFIAIAEAGGFVRAAATLHVAQPALSRQIRDLEDELKVSLFERSGRGVRLTFPGKCFLEDARRILAHLEQAQSRVRLAQNGQMGLLSVGMVESYTWHEVITRSICTFRNHSPGVMLTVVLMSSPDQLAAIADGRLSAGFLFNRPVANKELDGIKVLMERAMLAVPKTSHFARRPPKRLAELADEDFVFFPRTVNPPYYDEVMEACHRSGLTPRIVQWGTNDSSNLSLVSAGLGVTFCPGVARGRKPNNVVLVPVDDLNVVSTMEFVWRRDNRQQALQNFIQIFSERGRTSPAPSDLATNQPRADAARSETAAAPSTRARR